MSIHRSVWLLPPGVLTSVPHSSRCVVKCSLPFLYSWFSSYFFGLDSRIYFVFFVCGQFFPKDVSSFRCCCLHDGSGASAKVKRLTLDYFLFTVITVIITLSLVPLNYCCCFLRHDYCCCLLQLVMLLLLSLYYSLDLHSGVVKVTCMSIVLLLFDSIKWYAPLDETQKCVCSRPCEREMSRQLWSRPCSPSWSPQGCLWGGKCNAVMKGFDSINDRIRNCALSPNTSYRVNGAREASSKPLEEMSSVCTFIRITLAPFLDLQKVAAQTGLLCQSRRI